MSIEGYQAELTFRDIRTYCYGHWMRLYSMASSLDRHMMFQRPCWVDSGECKAKDGTPHWDMPVPKEPLMEPDISTPRRE